MAIKFLDSVAVDTDVLYVDAANNRVGINTLLPRTALEVVGTLRVWSGLNTHTYVETSSGSNLGSIQGKKNSDDAVRALALNPLGGNIGVNLGAGVLPTSKLEIALDTSSGSDGVFVKGEFAGGPSFTNSKNPFISLGTSTDSAYTSTIYLGSSATPTDQESKIEFNRSASSVSRLSIYHKGQGTYREHLRFGNPSSSIATSVFFGNVGINETVPAQSLHVAGNARVTGAYYDSNNSPGTAGQVLSSTATGTDWIAGGTGTITGEARENRIAFGSATANDITNDEDFTIVQTTNEKRIQIAGGVQVADMSALAGASLAGSLRYRVDGTRSYVDMCMQTSSGGYSWVNIVQNSWT